MRTDLSFLEDEILTDNMKDDLAKLVVSWLEYIAINRSDCLNTAISAVKLLNSDKASKTYSPVNTNLQVSVEHLELQLIHLEPQDSALIHTAEYILNQGENYESEEEILS